MYTYRKTCTLIEALTELERDGQGTKTISDMLHILRLQELVQRQDRPVDPRKPGGTDHFTRRILSEPEPRPVGRLTPQGVPIGVTEW